MNYDGTIKCHSKHQHGCLMSNFGYENDQQTSENDQQASENDQQASENDQRTCTLRFFSTTSLHILLPSTDILHPRLIVAWSQNV